MYACLNYWGADDLGLVDDLHILKVAEPPITVSSKIRQEQKRENDKTRRNQTGGG
ncbi:hypothetical protein HY798_01940 [Candidatus Falkowbacteria bacterium]|nr:hypothetical protein [Candidatus Falkowbacteria bacterium]